MEQDRAAGSSAETAAGPQVPAQARSGAQADAVAADFLGYRLCASHRLSVEGIAQGVRQRQRRARPLPALAAGRVLSADMACGFGRVRRDGGYRLALAERGWGYGQGAAGARMRGA